jgi:hypothetical protein
MTAIVNTFKGKFSDWAMAPMPGDGGAAKGALGGGNGYFFKKGLTADQIKAGLKWLAFEELTPGEGQFNYTVQKSIGLPWACPSPLIWKPGSDLQKKDDDLKKANSNLNLTDYALYSGNPIKPVAGARQRAGDLRDPRRSDGRRAHRPERERRRAAGRRPDEDPEGSGRRQQEVRRVGGRVHTRPLRVEQCSRTYRRVQMRLEHCSTRR